ncbi:leucine-rich repeat neuronal protein 3 [Lingula anatina]|uniref:Leucine-rich repeat neuronal protein 3 n=1 Tax=Lingula anatina TaxID=7574 RepID=A0A1S3IC54_LINAN|nr:leucine-rich repeat neuronal protein 3 [Lingula anatina]XP_013395441.1 leucine-rich repeat neuronal protein 3 [Lingula anatina]XP_013395442.1 leucine-rich repeat neuronal protein 3 [Lingula anatina]XP_013395443.1 leucine-rich repeat neuronal protein 3 [Lingula anatina]XP_013395444.1 leucine-rich repeat neuronal protein 3 [Lingula anatina]XP_013395445.1 leucine-rich repeat neuronal protein 3 [Lingula anatina]XP_013395446.1 leucine-rich repeat neuronal protein 3 [Lingula anatina]|eukprot:XP_013395440.1 leucine-rich repeat neuronal protein 3 [Lingula anatina]
MDFRLGNMTLIPLAFLMSVMLKNCIGQGYEPSCPVTETPDQTTEICFCIPESGEIFKWDIDCNFRGYGPNMPNFLQTDDVIGKLDFRYNSINHIQSYAFRNIPGLRELNLAEQHPVGNVSTLTVAPGAFHGLINLESLTLIRNRIENTTQVINPSTVDGLKNLKELYFFDNEIKKIGALAFAGLVNLEVLNLNYNYIASIHVNAFVGLNRLKKLFLTRNKLTRVDPGVFSSVTTLRQLFLNENQITEVAPKAFNGLRNLTDLRLNKNKLQSLDNMVIVGLDKREVFLHIGRNPLHCDCELKWLRSLEITPSGSCGTPKELRGESVVSFPTEDCGRVTAESSCIDDCPSNSGNKNDAFICALFSLAIAIAVPL